MNPLDASFEKKQKNVVSNMVTKTTGGLNRIMADWFGIVNPHHFFFLALLGMFTAAIAFLTDLISVYLIDLKVQIVRDQSLPYLARYGIYIACSIVFMVISAAMS